MAFCRTAWQCPLTLQFYSIVMWLDKNVYEEKCYLALNNVMGDPIVILLCWHIGSCRTIFTHVINLNGLKLKSTCRAYSGRSVSIFMVDFPYLAFGWRMQFLCSPRLLPSQHKRDAPPDLGSRYSLICITLASNAPGVSNGSIMRVAGDGRSDQSLHSNLSNH